MKKLVFCRLMKLGEENYEELRWWSLLRVVGEMNKNGEVILLHV